MEVSQPLDHVTHAVIGGSKTIDFGISNSAEFFDILSKTLYTDQHLAVVREVLCNAWDAHIEAGCTDKPIQISLDSERLIVRDFGLGIPHDKIGPIYGVYGNSTKKEDGAQTGGFGLGCKAPFAYTDHFEVISHHAGSKTIYNMSKSNAVAKGKPGIITIARFPTEEQGLQVSIPILDRDWRRFKENVQRIVQNGEMQAELNGKLLDTIPFSKAQHGFFLSPKEMVINTYGSSRILLRYGNVIYPISDHEEINKLLNSAAAVLNCFDSCSLVLQAPPDTISVTPSREALSMQEHTINTLKTLLRNFLKYTKTLSEEVLVQGRKLVEQTVEEKRYDLLFNEAWGFQQKWNNGTGLGDMTDLTGMAKYVLSQAYPESDLAFRLQDIRHRINTATNASMLNKHLAATFLDELKTVKNIPHRYSRASRNNRSDWLHRRIIGKVAVKLRDAGLSERELSIIDSIQATYSDSANRFSTPVRSVYGRNHLSNLPYLRKVVVVATNMGNLRERLLRYARETPGTQHKNILCFHVRSRKAGGTDKALNVFSKLGYTIIDLTKRHPWEPEEKPAVVRNKPVPYAGLPALSNIMVKGSIHIQRYREEGMVINANPSMVLIIGARASSLNALDGFSSLATKRIVELYGDHAGVAADKIQYKRAVKHGAADFQETMEAEMLDVLLNSPRVAAYRPFDYERIKETLPSYSYGYEALRAVFHDEDLRKLFNLENTMTAQERAFMDIYNYSKAISLETSDAIRAFMDAVPISDESHAVVKVTNNNELLRMLDLSVVRGGLKGPKRALYIDILTKVLKG